jgi:PmbA protein
MTKERYITHYVENAIKIVQTRVSSIRKKDIKKTSARLYDGKYMGVAGTLGDENEKDLLERAEQSLKLEVPYPFSPGRSMEREEDIKSDLQRESELLEETEAILEVLRETQPGFSFSQVFKQSTLETTIDNDLGLNLRSRRSFLNLTLVIKDRNSSNIMDAITGYSGRKFDREGFLDLTNMICDAYTKRTESFKDGYYPVVFIADDTTYLTKFYEALHGMLLGSGGSLFSGKLGEKLFSEEFTLYQSRNAEDGFEGPFFDTEGSFNDGDLFPLIENGVLKAPFTDKKSAALFNLPHTGSAGGEYDGIPELGFPKFKIRESEKTAKELLGDKKGIFVLIASGGDFTPDGHFATPAQLAFLFDGERLVGRLPELNISSHLYEMFGSSFLGVSSNNLLDLENSRVVVMNMKAEKII